MQRTGENASFYVPNELRKKEDVIAYYDTFIKGRKTKNVKILTPRKEERMITLPIGLDTSDADKLTDYYDSHYINYRKYMDVSKSPREDKLAQKLKGNK